MGRESLSMKTVLFGSINRKLTILFIIIGVVAPAIGIYYFYSISISLLAEGTDVFFEQSSLLQTTAGLIIVLIAVDTGIMGFLISRSISKPIVSLSKATQELEKGNFDIRTKISTNDEIEHLSRVFNKTTLALSKMDEERKQIDKAKSEFLSITSHELRTPITPMKAQLQMLENGYFGKLSKQQKESVAVLKRNAERLDRMIEDFLEISRIEAARLRFVFRETDLKQTVHETVEFMTGFANEKSIKLVIKIPSLPIIEVDPDRVSQVLRNLLHNAIKFSNENSTIEITATKKPGYIVFSVKDYGVGMSSEDQLQVFEPFYQVEDHLKRKHGGTGLGLAICRGIVEAQKGKIWVESKVGKGSTFNFTIPLEPVKEIEPIKVLFSSIADIEKKVREEFTLFLGPMGAVEFDEIKNKHAFGKDNIMSYIELLQDLSILSDAKGVEFKRRIAGIFGDENEPEQRAIPMDENRFEKISNELEVGR